MLSPENPVLIEIETPALVIDATALDRNIVGMAEIASAQGIALRPHAKTHKSAEVALRQKAAGAIGIACATILEAEALCAAGIDGLMLTAPMMSASKSERVAALHRKLPLHMVVDHVSQVEALVRWLRPEDTLLGVLVDVDVGQQRTGVATASAAVSLAKAIAAEPRLAFVGLQGYAGHVQHVLDALERKAAAEASAQVLRDVVKAMTDAGLPPRIVSGSGTGTHRHDIHGPYTELQVGSYVFMDADYARVLDESGTGPAFMPSLFVLATVVSVNRPGQVTVDAGTKALATNGPPPCHLIGAPSGSTYKFAGDEHGIVMLPPGATQPAIGSRMLIGATHCDPTVNLHACYHAVTAGGIERWTIQGRYA